jgi:hypothetical protein
MQIPVLLPDTSGWRRDEHAYAEFQRTVAEEGMGAFADEVRVTLFLSVALIE